MSKINKVEKTIYYHNNAFIKRQWYDCVQYYGYLEEAEEAVIISRNWRKRINIQNIAFIVHENLDIIEGIFENTFLHEKNILEFGGEMEYEEVMLILTYRSSLQSVARYLPPSRYIIADDIDILLAQALNTNINNASRCRNSKSVGVESVLPNHWWWRTNTPK